MSHISIKNINKIYGSGESEVRALDNVSVRIGQKYTP